MFMASVMDQTCQSRTKFKFPILSKEERDDILEQVGRPKCQYSKNLKPSRLGGWPPQDVIDHLESGPGFPALMKCSRRMAERGEDYQHLRM
jgi:hypothetical protein